MTDVLLKAYGIKKSFIRDQQRLQILHGLDFEIKSGESVAIVGGSGAGKSTLLQILGTLDSPTEGEVYFKDQNVTHWSDQKLADFRNKNLGFVFQFHHLLQEFTALENVMFPCLIQKMPKNLAKEKASYVLSELGLKDRLDHFPSQLSGGEQQRVAIARAVVLKPALILADEPTGNLDAKNTKQIQRVFLDLVEKFETSVVVVTHDRDFASGFNRIFELKDGLWEHLSFA
jgi:lipoprotein-releasing system ATP-binding protein